MSLPPGPSAPPLVQTLRWAFRPLAFLRDCERQHGDAFSVRFAGFERPMVMVSDPVVIRAIYSEASNALPPGRNAVIEPVVGPLSVLVLEGFEHLARRKLMLPPFHGERMRAHEAKVRKSIAAELDTWPLDTPFPIHNRMHTITLEVVLHELFGDDGGWLVDDLRAEMQRVLQETSSGIGQLALATRRFSKRGPWARFEKQLQRVNELLYALIDAHRRRADLAERDDILAMMMSAEFDDGSRMSDDELRDQLISLLIAGHETTATALAWTFDLLLRHPEALGRLRDSITSGEDAYLRATITESLRLRPVVPIAARRLTAPLQAGDLDLPAGTDVTAAIWLTHTREDIYPEPFAFRPERFLDEKPDTYAWIPFGGGVRRCLGATFAEFEMRVVLREVLVRCELRKADPNPDRICRRNITLSPRDGTQVVIESRVPSPEPKLAVA